MVGILTFGDAGLCTLVKRSTSHNSRFGRNFSSKMWKNKRNEGLFSSSDKKISYSLIGGKAQNTFPGDSHKALKLFVVLSSGREDGWIILGQRLTF